VSKHNRGHPHHLFNLEDIFDCSFFLSSLLLYWLNGLLKVLDLLSKPLKQLLGLTSCRGKSWFLEFDTIKSLDLLQAHLLLAVRILQEDLWIHYEVLGVSHCFKVLSAAEEQTALIKLILLLICKSWGGLRRRRSWSIRWKLRVKLSEGFLVFESSFLVLLCILPHPLSFIKVSKVQ
jgi:hypothetical protein